MSLTLNKITFDILNILRGGNQSDDEQISQRQVHQWIHNTRATLIRNDLNKGRSISDNISQSLGCLTVSQVDASQCCGVNTDCNVYRTTVTLPKPIEINQEDLITRVGPVALGERPFHLIPMERVPYVGYTPFRGINESIKAVYDGGYIYIFVPKSNRVIKKITVEGVFADPTEVRTFNNCSGSACYTNDSAYPISEHMIETMKQMILSTNGKIITQSLTDSKGDSDSKVETNITR